MTIDTIQYYPPHIQRMKEFIRLSQAHDIKLTEAWEAVELLTLNMYYSTMDEDTCARWESLLGITVDTGSDLDTRRAKIMAYAVSNLPYTEKKIREILSALCGEDNYELTIDASVGSVSLTITDGNISLARETYTLLRKMIPADMGISSAAEDETSSAAYMNSATSYYTLAPAIHEATVSESEIDSVSYANTVTSGYTVSSIYETA